MPSVHAEKVKEGHMPTSSFCTCRKSKRNKIKEGICLLVAPVHAEKVKETKERK
jgi:hypothetical protein